MTHTRAHAQFMAAMKWSSAGVCNTGWICGFVVPQLFVISYLVLCCGGQVWFADVFAFYFGRMCMRKPVVVVLSPCVSSS